jgi:hypothetical protein
MNTYYPDDPLYEKAKTILAANPDIGKNKLGLLLGVKAPSSRLRIVRYRGETQGHNTHPDYVRVRQLKEQHPEWSACKIALTLNLTIDHTKLHLARWTGAQSYSSGRPTMPAAAPAPEPGTAPRGEELQISGAEDKQDVCYRGTRIRTVEALLASTETDTAIWEVERHVINKWEVGAKDTANGGILTEPLFQIKLWLRRKVIEQHLKNLMDGLLDRFRHAAPIQPAIRHQNEGRGGMLELSLMDLHFGKYCSALETGRSYDADIADKMFTTALHDLLNKARGLKLEKILFVVGNDFFNTDNLGRTTTAGTPQDECLRYQESFLRGKEMLVRAIHHLRQAAPVEVLMVTGNHDTQRLYYLGHALEGIFANTPNVKVENSMRQRKYVRFHKNLIGFTHGNNEKHFDLPLLLATEDKDGWAQSKHREFHLGHFHSRKHKMFVPSYDRGGVLVRILPSLCPPDAWHASMGYNARLAAEALYFDPEEGCVATFTHSPN